MASTPLISTTELAASLSDPDLRIIDCRFDLSDPEAGATAYAQSRIPSARYAHLDRDLSNLSNSATHGRHPLPGMSQLAASLSRLGVNRHSKVVAYDQDKGAYAARLWWLLHSCGFPSVRVLDGGFAAWKRDGYEVETTETLAASATHLPARLELPKHQWLDAEAVANGLQTRTITLIDARARPRFRGDVEPLDSVAGHVPGALNRPFLDNLDVSGQFKPAVQLRREFEALLDGRAPNTVVHLCGSGVTACHNRLAMDLAGLGGSRLYPDSWSGWITDPERPVARGD
jgi:thiosulfate/3-mercaptopyruvate sulfurtransferase